MSNSCSYLSIGSMEKSDMTCILVHYLVYFIILFYHLTGGFY